MNRHLARVPTGVPVSVFLDYDGTLVPIRQRPDLAVLSPQRRTELARLARRTLVGIVSGRPLAELRRMVAVPGAAYIGNHGMEIRAGGRTWIHPEAKSKAEAVARAASAIERRTSGYPGIFVERKGLTASVHYRLAAAGFRGPVRAIVAEEIRRNRGILALTRGKMVLEIRPNVEWDKGCGVLKLMDLAGCPRWCFPVYIGDDRTDEDAFRALAGWGLTLHVGPKKRTLAERRIPSVDRVWAFLGELRPHVPPFATVKKPCRPSPLRRVQGRQGL
jgi:trehalose-phosphatase